MSYSDFINDRIAEQGDILRTNVQEDGSTVRVSGFDNSIAGDSFHIDVTGSRNVIGSGCENIVIVGSYNVIPGGLRNVQIVGSNVTATGSDFSYSGGITTQSGVVKQVVDVLDAMDDSVIAFGDVAINYVDALDDKVFEWGSATTRNYIDGGQA